MLCEIAAVAGPALQGGHNGRTVHTSPGARARETRPKGCTSSLSAVSIADADAGGELQY
jgi:hypothetical protein